MNMKFQASEVVFPFTEVTESIMQSSLFTLLSKN